MKSRFLFGSTVVATIAIVFPVFAQPAIQSKQPTHPAFPIRVLEVDPTAGTLQIMVPGVVTVNTLPDGNQTVQAEEGKASTVTIIPSVLLTKVEGRVAVSELRVGDTVSLLGEKATVRTVIPNILQGLGEARYNINAEQFKVTSLEPLILMKGDSPSEGSEELLSVPFTNGPNAKPIGNLSVSRSRFGSISLQTAPRDGGTPSKTIKVSTPELLSITLRLNETQALQFKRFTAINLTDVAAAKAANQPIEVETETTPDGTLLVKRVTVVRY